MRIAAIRLSWFRGAADPVELDLGCRSAVVYGANGSGKSSFVDAVEYALNDGKIRHLAHEYSGKRQEKAAPNTHKPRGRKTEIGVRFKDESELEIEIKENGSATSSGAEAAAIGTWDYRRTILRQDEVAEFIRDTKGGKYSSLLPLLGLQPMEVAAENLRQLAKAVEQRSRVRETKAALKEVETRRQAAFGADSNTEILAKLDWLHASYCAEGSVAKDSLSRADEVGAALEARIARSSADHKRHFALLDAAEVDLVGHVAAIRVSNSKLASAVEPLVAERLAVLQSTRLFVERLGDEEEVDCPACGLRIPVAAFQAHVKAERERLQGVIETFDTRKAGIGILCDSLKAVRSSLGKPDVRSWRDEIREGPLADSFVYLEGLNTEGLRASCGDEDLQGIEAKLVPLVDAAASACRDAPPDAQQMWTDKQMVEAGRAVIAGKEQAADASRAEALVSFINCLEQGIREEIKLRSQAVIDSISADVQAMWGILHPGEAIEHVHLYLPKDADKAIDIGLKFYGVEQDSPRLTLSEGYRNSLGLCIFLAMAKREADRDRPLFLDDVVVSLDRNHRGMVAELLEKEFGGRQVVVLTHDREWYAELRQQLDDKHWAFKALLPYETPGVGIRWSHKTATFDDARAHLKDRADSAGNDARKIMDVELALVAQHLQIKLPYLRGDKNDKRMAHDLLERLIVDGEECFEKKAGAGYVANADAIKALHTADRLLVSWGNKASHTFDLVRSEATKLIDACERALGFFRCGTCGKWVWSAEVAGSKLVQCQCGEIRWRYGKA